MTATVYDITDAAPRKKKRTFIDRKRAFYGGAAVGGIFAAGLLLLIDDKIDGFRNRKEHVIIEVPADDDH